MRGIYLEMVAMTCRSPDPPLSIDCLEALFINAGCQREGVAYPPQRNDPGQIQTLSMLPVMYVYQN